MPQIGTEICLATLKHYHLLTYTMTLHALMNHKLNILNTRGGHYVTEFFINLQEAYFKVVH